jgi:hypothetical protein
VAVCGEVVEFVGPDRGVVGVREHVHAETIDEFGNSQDVIPMGVGEHDVLDVEIAGRVGDATSVVSRVDHDRLSGGRGCHDPTVGAEVTDSDATYEEPAVGEFQVGGHRRGSVTARCASTTRWSALAIVRCSRSVRWRVN